MGAISEAGFSRKGPALALLAAALGACATARTGSPAKASTLTAGEAAEALASDPGVASLGGALAGLEPPLLAPAPCPEDIDPERLNRDHERIAAEMGPEWGTASWKLGDYFGCRALARRDPSLCEPLDRWATDEVRPCLMRYYDGLLTKAAFAGGEETKELCRFLLDAVFPLEPEARAAAQAGCASIGLMAEGDAPKMCARMFQDGVLAVRGRSWADCPPGGGSCCPEVFAHIGGRSEPCLTTNDREVEDRCLQLTKLVRALRGEASAAGDTIYATLVGGDPSVCDSFGRQAVASYCAHFERLEADRLAERKQAWRRAIETRLESVDDAKRREDAGLPYGDGAGGTPQEKEP